MSAANWICLVICLPAALLEVRFTVLRAGYQFQVFMAVCATVAAVGWLTPPDPDLALAIGWAVAAAIRAWLAWQDRPRRKRRPSKLAARVRDLGHRLTVEPAGAR